MTFETGRTTAEQRLFERMAECYDRDLPSDDEVGRARRRLERRRVAVRRVSGKLFLALVVQGFVLGVVTLAAASWVTERVLFAPEISQRASVTKGTSGTGSPGAPRRANGMRKRQDDGTVPSPPRAAFADLPRGVSSRSTPTSAAGRVTEGRLESAPVPAGGPSSGAAASPLPSVTSVDETHAGPWSRVSRALAASDWTAADRALVELGASPDAEARDAAELARAQLWIAHGNGERFRGSVERLARSGATPLVRRRAAGLLEQLR